jgi:hypothetical protein
MKVKYITFSMNLKSELLLIIKDEGSIILLNILFLFTLKMTLQKKFRLQTEKV